MKITAMLFVLISFSVFGVEPDAGGGSFSLNDLNQALSGERPLQPTVDCFDPRETPVCGDINRQYCRNMTANQGRATDPTGNVNVGKSERSQISEVERLNLVNLTTMLPALPADLRSELERPVARLATLVQSENDSRNWYKDVARVRAEMTSKIQDVANRRADVSLRTRVPRGQRATRADRTAERDEQFRALMDTVSRAKMTTSPNWPRINNVFARVKEDLLSVINTLPLTPEEKQQRINRINSTNLSTPFGVRVGGVLGQIMESDCRTNMVNAFYLDLNNSLTICGGIANGFQSENALYFTLAHELAHSFNQKFLQDENSSPRWSRLNERLLATNGNMPCDEYTRVTNESRNENSFNCGRDTYTNFMNCVSGLTPDDIPPSDNQASAMQVLRQMNVCSVLDRDQGLAFMNPNEFADRNFNRLVSSTLQEFVGSTPVNGRALLSPVYLVAQEKRCNPSRSCAEVSTDAALRMGLNSPPVCRAIADRGAENESDWYAHKALTLRLRSMTDVRARRELVAGSMGLFCGNTYTRSPSEKDLGRLQAEFIKIAAEGGMENDNHASNGDRQNAMMTEDMASLLQCSRPEGASAPASYQSCRL